MKTRHRRILRTTTLGATLLIATTFASPGSAAGAASPPPPADTSAQPTMFMGLNLSVEHDGARMGVIDVTDEAIYVSQEGKAYRVPTQGKFLRLDVKHALKLSDASATIENLEATRSYTPKRDPYRKFESAAAGSSGVGATIDLTQVGVRGAEISYALATGIVNSGAYAPGAASTQASAQAAMNQASSDLATASLGAYADQNLVSTHSDKLREELAEENFDALDIEFEVSSPIPLSSPFVVVLIKYRNKATPDEEPRTWIITKALAPIGPETKKVRFKQGALPLGYLLDSHQVHLFDRGAEIATTVAPMRTALTPDEAFQYRVVDYVSAHPDATLPAAPAAGEITDPLRATIASQYANRPIYVQVLPTGRADGVFSDRACKKPLPDPALEAMLALVRFDPALEKGKPVRGVVMLVGKPG